ncbi:hypothetical protein AB0K60_16500 [Thermopolyspora sp. NPDC052614]|uniref:hypothetical protein n=1 Tax=Thermopolyspora sp. NPDC052614 TaxID=3155682 RepID=UPI003420257E
MARSSTLAKREINPAFRKDAAGRHLCTGVYRDRALRDMVLRHVHNDTNHLVAPSYGFDLVPVVVHAWRAWTLEMLQHLCVVGTIAIGVAVHPPAAFSTACVLGCLRLSRQAITSGLAMLPLQAKATMDKWLRRTRWRSESDELRYHKRLLRLTALGCAVLALAPLLVAGLAQASPDQMTRATILLSLLIALAVGGHGAAQQVCLNRMYRTASLEPKTLTRRLQAIKDQQFHRYVVYRRHASEQREVDATLDDAEAFTDEDHTPFVGAGVLVHRWLPPLTVPLLRRAQDAGNPSGHVPMSVLEHATPPFRAHELVAFLRRAMALIGDTEDPMGLRGFTIRDRLYVDEADVQASPVWLEDPSGRDDIDPAIDDPYGPVHHFLEISASATGELVTTVFLRVTVKGRALSLDFAACALTRTPAEYQVLNAFAESGAGAVLRAILRRLFNLPTEVAQAWRLAEAPMLLLGAIRARKTRLVKPRRGMAIGARLSVREEASTPWEHAQLDKVTIHDHVKLIEQRLLKATEDFLEAHEIDTSGFRRRAASIINTGVLNMGGKTEIKQSAVGPHAQVRMDVRESDGGQGQPSAGEGGQS